MLFFIILPFLQLTSRINKMLRDFAGENLPHDSISAKQMLQEHLTSYRTVEELFAQTVNYGKDALKAVGEEESFGSPKEEIEKLLKMSKEKHEEWEQLWESHKQRLQESMSVCHFEQDISQVSKCYALTRACVCVWCYACVFVWVCTLCFILFARTRLCVMFVFSVCVYVLMCLFV